MTISTEQILMVIGGASTVTTAIFWGAFLLGRLHSRVEAIEHRMDRAGRMMSDLTDKVQTFPSQYLSRNEAMHWNGSRAEDRK